MLNCMIKILYSWIKEEPNYKDSSINPELPHGIWLFNLHDVEVETRPYLCRRKDGKDSKFNKIVWLVDELKSSHVLIE